MTIVRLQITLFGVLVFLAGTVYGVAPAAGETFVYKYNDGEKYHIDSQVSEQVYVNDDYSHTSDILDKISVNVIGTKPDDTGTSGRLDVDFITSERAYGSGSVYTWGEQYHSTFWRDALGVFDIDPSYFMPTVRNVPQFPKRDVQVGDTWSLPGEEVHDLRPNFHLSQPLHFPVTVSYTYLGPVQMDGETYDHIAIDYPIFYKITEYDGLSQMHPVRVSGFSHQHLYWDNTAGRPHSYSEQFDIIFDFSTGDTVEYTGSAESTVTAVTPMDKQKVADAIRKELSDNGVANTEVNPVPEGVSISLERIQFQADSAELQPQEKDKLRKIAKILQEYPNRDILVTGHTALAGTESGRQELSLERAQAVGNFLISLGALKPSQISVKGVGATQPIADDSTEAGREKNRRVEITILEN